MTSGSLRDGPGALPSQVRQGIARVLGGRGHEGHVRSAASVAGGCIHRALHLETDAGPVFLKWNPDAPSDLFAAEANGLDALGAAARDAGLRVPEVLGWGGGGDEGPGWILMEWIEAGRGPAGSGVVLGEALARFHRPVPGAWGWSRGNHVGSLPQDNAERTTWGAFWREQRLEPFLRRAMDAGAFSGAGAGADWARLLDRVEEWASPAAEDGPSILHGDLWSGNVFFSRQGEPVLVDPAVCRGHREVDLAMMELFGGFPRGTLDAYRDARPLHPGYNSHRRDLYQLHPLLVHVILFGGGYEADAMERVGRLLRS